MEHAKKLVISEPKLFRPTIHDKAMTSLDSDISKTLGSDESDEVKISNYLSAIRRYKYYDAASDATKPKPLDTADTLRDVLDTISPDKRHKAKRLLYHLNSDPEVKIDETGQLIFRQNKVEGSNISRLLDEALDAKKSKSALHPPGWEQLSHSLLATDAPRKLIVNNDLWEHMHPAELIASKKKKKKQEDPPRVSSRRKRKALTGAGAGWLTF